MLLSDCMHVHVLVQCPCHAYPRCGGEPLDLFGNSNSTFTVHFLATVVYLAWVYLLCTCTYVMASSIQVTDVQAIQKNGFTVCVSRYHKRLYCTHTFPLHTLTQTHTHTPIQTLQTNTHVHPVGIV